MSNLETLIENTDIYILDSLEDTKEFVDILDVMINISDVEALFAIMHFPLTIVHEKYYCDKVHRDSYYNYYSRKHFSVNRNCQRLSFFCGDYEYNDFYNGNNQLNENFLGTLIITPSFDFNNNTSIGRILLDPFKLKLKECYLRTTQFNVCILGQEYSIPAFPFMRQNTITMSCAETVIWSMMEYFGNRYPNYKSVLPSDILSCLNEYTEERIIPSEGLENFDISIALKKFGFEPKCYSKSEYNNDFKKVFHYYIESAIIVAMDLEPADKDSAKPHATICIGHAAEKDLNLSNDNFIKEFNNDLYAIDSSCFYNKYVIIDDNQYPYIIQEFDKFSNNNTMHLNAFIAPLYKHIYLDAKDASTITLGFLNSKKAFIKKILELNDIINNENNPIILRFFLTTSKNFKKCRLKNSEQSFEKMFYSNIPYAKMVWVCEMIDYNLYKKDILKCVIGEVILDATSAPIESLASVVSFRLCDFSTFRMPDESYNVIRDDFYQKNKSELTFPYEMYLDYNLTKGGQLL